MCCWNLETLVSYITLNFAKCTSKPAQNEFLDFTLYDCIVKSQLLQGYEKKNH